MLKWVFERVDGDADAVDTPIGLLPTPDAARHRRARHRRTPTSRRCCRSTPTAGAGRCPQIREHYGQFGDDLPAPLVDAVDMLERNLQTA